MKWIVANHEHLGGLPRIKGTRISVALLLQSLAVGMTIQEIVEEYPSLTEEAVRGVLQELSEQEERAIA